MPRPRIVECKLKSVCPMACNTASSAGYARFSLHIQTTVQSELPKGADIDDIAREIERRWRKLSVDGRDSWGHSFYIGSPMGIARVKAAQHSKDFIICKETPTALANASKHDYAVVTSQQSSDVHDGKGGDAKVINDFESNGRNIIRGEEKTQTQESEKQDISKIGKRKSGKMENVQVSPIEGAKVNANAYEKRMIPQQAHPDPVLHTELSYHKQEFIREFCKSSKLRVIRVFQNGFVIQSDGSHLMPEQFIPFEAYNGHFFAPSDFSNPTTSNVNPQKEQARQQNKIQKLQLNKSPQIKDAGDCTAQNLKDGPFCEDKVLQEKIRKRPFTCLATEDDSKVLSGFLSFLREECIEVFEATHEDVLARKPLKNIQLNQVGVRCRFCVHLNFKKRVGRASTFPSSRSRIYQSVKMMVREHFPHCTEMLPEVRKTFSMYREDKRKSISKGSRSYWADSAFSLGMEDSPEGRIKMKKPLQPG